MIKIQKYSTIVAIAGLLAMIIPIAANAQVQNRLKNAEANRDYRNIQLKRTASSTRPMMATPTRTKENDRERGENRAVSIMPKWLSATSSPWKNNMMSFATSSKRLPDFLEKMASSTELKGHENWKETRIDKFALLQSNLMCELDRSLSQLKTVRVKLAARIATAIQNGRDMANAQSLLAIADQKITAAEKAVSDVDSFVPPAITSARIAANASANVTLERPRVIGQIAISALKDAKKALNDVVGEIARSMGLKLGQDNDSNSKKNATSTATTTDQ